MTTKEIISTGTRDYPSATAWMHAAPLYVTGDKARAEATYGPVQIVSVSHTVHLNSDGSLAVTYLIVYARS